MRMSSGFSGGGADFYGSMAGRSIPTGNVPSQPAYRSQLPHMFLDPLTQHRTSTTNLSSPHSFIGKRTLSDFQAHQQSYQQQQLQHTNLSPALNGLLRSVKPRMHQNTSPIEFPANLSDFSVLRPQSINIGPANNHASLGLSYQNHNHNQDTQKKVMNRLQELEKQLFDDNDEDDVSVITNANSEWSEPIQSLIASSCSNPVSPSSTSSSSSSSTSVTTPAVNCTKQTLIEAASAIYDAKNDVAAEILTRVSQLSNPRGNSEQRLMEYMSMALKSRLDASKSPSPVAELFGKQHVASTQLLYELSPCFKLGFMAANLAILESTIDQPNNGNGFHVIDFDIGQGCQYLNLFHAVSERLNGKPATVKITAVAADNGREHREGLKGVGTSLSQVARQFGLSLHFNVVSCKLGVLSRQSLGCEPDEPLAVNFAFNLYRMPDESVSTENPRDELLRRVRAMSPRVVTLVEQEMNTNTAPFMARVNEVSSYYGAIFDSIESTVQRDNSERIRLEEGLARRLANSVACEGRDRVERCEVFGKWRARMGMAGFELKPMSQNIAESMKSRLSSRDRVNPGFTVKQENGGVSFGWMGKTLTVASAWR